MMKTRTSQEAIDFVAGNRNMTGLQLAKKMNNRGMRTAQGKRWTKWTVGNIRERINTGVYVPTNVPKTATTTTADARLSAIRAIISVTDMPLEKRLGHVKELAGITA